jgi:hypothetical protein
MGRRWRFDCLTLYVQADFPGKDKESNWLPAPNDKFYVILRCYLPGSGIVEQTWSPPPIQKAK